MPSSIMSLMTDAMDDNTNIDPRYTCDIDNSSPELRWENPPPNTAEFALTMEDLDAPAGIFTHWIIYNIPSEIRHLPTGIPPQDTLPNGIHQGVNSFGKLGYAGPCPPFGDKPHRYVFRLFALNHKVELPHRVRREALLDALSPLIITTGELTCRYQRSIRRAG